MRLLRTTDLTFVEYYEADVPQFGILSHRWASTDEEVSYDDLKNGLKRSTTGFAKIKKFCDIVQQQDHLDYCWVDTCCIDKNSSAELTEAINSMYRWYERAVVCYAYLSDINGGNFLESKWFTRGWTLQELLAPTKVLFIDRSWRLLGTKFGLARQIATITGIEQSLLCGRTTIQDYSVAQRMSWASKRETTRKEDEAYCLLGLFQVNMPLLYGEGPRAFRRLQEEILSSGGDSSLFAWDDTDSARQYPKVPDGQQNAPRASENPSLNDGDIWNYRHRRAESILAPSPGNFRWSSNVKSGFTSNRILFEKTNRGLMVLIHHSYDPEALDQLLAMSKDMRRLDRKAPLGLTLPLGCYRKIHDRVEGSELEEAIFLSLMLDGGKWRRIGITSYHDPESTIRFRGAHYAAYRNDYVRFYVHHEMPEPGSTNRFAMADLDGKTIRFLDIRDRFT